MGTADPRGGMWRPGLEAGRAGTLGTAVATRPPTGDAAGPDPITPKEFPMLRSLFKMFLARRAIGALTRAFRRR